MSLGIGGSHSAGAGLGAGSGCGSDPGAPAERRFRPLHRARVRAALRRSAAARGSSIAWRMVGPACFGRARGRVGILPLRCYRWCRQAQGIGIKEHNLLAFAVVAQAAWESCELAGRAHCIVAAKPARLIHELVDALFVESLGEEPSVEGFAAGINYEHQIEEFG